MAANDDRGLQLLDACRRVGAVVPDEVAVLGLDNDEYLCGLSLPPLSSIDVDSETTGYQAAALLDRMMDGKRPPKRIAETVPAGVVTRRSTDVLATDDRDVIRAVQYIRENACRTIQVADILEHVSMSRAALEPRFRSVLGRTLHQEVQRVRVERAKSLLAENRSANQANRGAKRVQERTVPHASLQRGCRPNARCLSQESTARGNRVVGSRCAGQKRSGLTFEDIRFSLVGGLQSLRHLRHGRIRPRARDPHVRPLRRRWLPAGANRYASVIGFFST
jgi:AraC-like DNA-binding protein